MPQLSLSFLGPFTVRSDDQPITRFESDKVRALLAYLAVEAGKPHRRSALAGLLWSEHPERAARASLRNALAGLRRVIQDQKAEPPFLLIERETVQFNSLSDHWLDVQAFEALLTWHDQPPATDIPGSKINNLKSAVSLYHGPFLQGFSLKDSPIFDEWVLLTREDLNHKVRLAYTTLAQEFELREDYDQACTYAFRLVNLEPWHEAAHRQLIRLLALNGQRAAALAQYEACRRSLREELDVEPDVETVELYEQIRARKITGSARPKEPLHNLPAMLSPLIGREAELQGLSSCLDDPACRLLTVVGPGGCGKTRLSIEAAYRQVDRFQHGVYFVALAGIPSSQAIPQALAQALGFSFSHEGEPWQQLMDYLRQKRVLLVLDNFEHLLAGARLLVELLRTAPGVKMLVTSRSRLNVMEESLLPLGGMAYPEGALPESGETDLAGYGAVRLFLEGARRVEPGFAPGAEDMGQVGAICRMVAGLPLAVLLSASWAGLLRPVEIAARIRRHSLDFLETEWQDVPERHRSLRHVFEHSWELLSREQREGLAGLSVFPGRFSIQAAWGVTRVDLHALRDLVDRSWVQPASAERFDLHTLTRQYASEQLDRLLGKRDEYRERYSAYFLEMLARWAIDLQGADQWEAQREIALEIENLAVAWEWGLEQAQYDRLPQALDGLGGLYERLCLYREGEQVLRSSIAQLKDRLTPEPDRRLMALLVRMLGWQSLFSRMLGNNQSARQVIDLGVELLDGLSLPAGDISFERAFLLQQKGLLLFSTDYARAQMDLEASLGMYRLAGNTWREAQVLTSLAQVANLQGRYSEAEVLLEQSLVIRRALGDYTGMADTLREMSTTLAEFGDFRKMAEIVQEHAVILRELGSPAQLADNLLLEGVNVGYLGRFAETARLMEEALAIYESLGNQSMCMSLTCLLGWVEVNEGCYDQGCEKHQSSLAMARQLGDTRGIALNLLGLSEIYLLQGAYAQARQILEESISLYRQIRQEDELGITLAELADAESRLGLCQQARIHLREALIIAEQTGSWQACVHVVGKTALFRSRLAEVERGVELYALAARYPYLGNSRFWEDTAGEEIGELAARLPTEVVTAARERGRQRDLRTTVSELLAEFDAAVFGEATSASH